MAEIKLKALPPEEAIAYFAAKGKRLHPSFAWQDVWQEQHAQAFTVAKSVGYDILGDVHQAVLAAEKEGTTFEEFRKRLTPVLQAKGWWGVQRMVDPETGRRRAVQLGSPRRLRIIFDTNLRMSHAVGRWAQIQRVKSRRPWLRYSSVLDGKTRPLHRAWHGTILPADHPWWDTHYPPNGWRCRCSVVQLSDADLKRRGWTPSPSAPDDGPPRAYVNPRTGETTMVPAGIDPGFAYNPGKAAVGRPPGGGGADRPPRRGDPGFDQAAALAAMPVAQRVTWFAGQGAVIRQQLVDQVGRQLGDVDGADPDAFGNLFARLLDERLAAERGAGSLPLAMTGADAASRWVAAAAARFPASWVRAANAHGRLHVFEGQGRGWAYSADQAVDHHWDPPVGRLSLAAGDGILVIRPNPATTLHELTHRLQAAMPGLDELFQELHRRRTVAEPLSHLGPGYHPNERGRRDRYLHVYFGKEYDGRNKPALEVITMAMQLAMTDLGGVRWQLRLIKDDPEMLDLVLGVLFRYDP